MTRNEAARCGVAITTTGLNRQHVWGDLTCQRRTNSSIDPGLLRRHQLLEQSRPLG
jgi:hypothetical protein